MKRAISAFALTFIVSTAVAQVSQNAYNFLRLPVSAHAAALGGDNITIIDDRSEEHTSELQSRI